MWKNFLLFVAGMVTATVVVWVLPNTCDVALNAVQGVIDGAPVLVDTVRGWTTKEW